MKKLLFALCILPSLLFAQVPSNYSNEDKWILMGGITIYDVERNFLGGGTYSVLYRMAELSDEASLSVGSHLGLGLSYSNIAGGFLMFTSPVLVHAHLGHTSTPFSKFPVGFSLGLGSDAAIVGVSNLPIEFVYGPMVDLNLKVRLPGYRSYTLRASYTRNLYQGLIFGDMINIGLYSNF